ncbi:MAG TPA: MarR family transcriptional regulator [Clostridia bacterium]|nr:MarR family transcriptional regulator [Clostridia bacterium]
MVRCPDDFIGRWFSVLHRSSIGFMTNELKRYGIGSGQIMFLLELYHCDGINQEELSSFLNIDKANTARALGKLEQEGYLVKKADREDKRAYKIYLTEKALEIKPKIMGVMADWENHLLKELSPEERSFLRKTMKKVGHNCAGNSRCRFCSSPCGE